MQEATKESSKHQNFTKKYSSLPSKSEVESIKNLIKETVEADQDQIEPKLEDFNKIHPLNFNHVNKNEKIILLEKIVNLTTKKNKLEIKKKSIFALCNLLENLTKTSIFNFRELIGEVRIEDQNELEEALLALMSEKDLEFIGKLTQAISIFLKNQRKTRRLWQEFLSIDFKELNSLREVAQNYENSDSSSSILTSILVNIQQFGSLYEIPVDLSGDILKKFFEISNLVEDKNRLFDHSARNYLVDECLQSSVFEVIDTQLRKEIFEKVTSLTSFKVLCIEADFKFLNSSINESYQKSKILIKKAFEKIIEFFSLGDKREQKRFIAKFFKLNGCMMYIRNLDKAELESVCKVFQVLKSCIPFEEIYFGDKTYLVNYLNFMEKIFKKKDTPLRIKDSKGNFTLASINLQNRCKILNYHATHSMKTDEAQDFQKRFTFLSEIVKNCVFENPRRHSKFMEPYFDTHKPGNIPAKIIRNLCDETKEGLTWNVNQFETQSEITFTKRHKRFLKFSEKTYLVFSSKGVDNTLVRFIYVVTGECYETAKIKIFNSNFKLLKQIPFKQLVGLKADESWYYEKNFLSYLYCLKFKVLRFNQQKEHEDILVIRSYKSSELGFYSLLKTERLFTKNFEESVKNFKTFDEKLLICLQTKLLVCESDQKDIKIKKTINFYDHIFRVFRQEGRKVGVSFKFFNDILVFDIDEALKMEEDKDPNFQVFRYLDKENVNFWRHLLCRFNSTDMNMYDLFIRYDGRLRIKRRAVE